MPLIASQGLSALLMTTPASNSQDPNEGTDANTLRAEQLKAEGNELFKSGEFAGAIDKYCQAIELQPNNFLLYGNRSYARLKQGDAQGAVEDGRSAITINRNWAKGWARVAEAYLALRDYRMATGAIHEAQRLSPDNAQYLKIQAMIHKAATEASGPGPEDMLVESVRTMLQAAGLSESDLPCDPREMDQGRLAEFLEQQALAKPEVKAKLDSYSNSLMKTFSSDEDYREEAVRLPQNPEDVWLVTFTDLPAFSASGQNMYMVIISGLDGGGTKPRVMSQVEGFPEVNKLIKALWKAMARPQSGRPYRPRGLLIANRLSSQYDGLRTHMEPLGITMKLEPREEAEALSSVFGTSPDGINCGQAQPQEF